jgi:hypothetical protein
VLDVVLIVVDVDVLDVVVYAADVDHSFVLVFVDVVFVFVVVLKVVGMYETVVAAVAVAFAN